TPPPLRRAHTRAPPAAMATASTIGGGMAVAGGSGGSGGNGFPPRRFLISSRSFSRCFLCFQGVSDGSWFLPPSFLHAESVSLASGSGRSSRPQHWTLPEASSPQVNSSPRAICERPFACARTGEDREISVPSPSSPASLSPQQASAPLVSRAHACP